MTLVLDEKTRKEIGKRLKEARLKKNLTQLEVATQAEISDGYYARIERGKEHPTLAMLKKLFSVLKVKSSDILPF